MNDIEKLIELFKSFPGVGPRQAKRFVYYLLRKNSNYTSELAELIPRVKSLTKRCDICQRFFISQYNQEVQTSCKICSDHNRNTEKLLLIAHDNDLESIEKAGAYNGYYFVLGGYIPLLEEHPEKFIRITELKNRLQKNDEEVGEIILGLSSNPDGQHTQQFIHEYVQSNFPTITVTEFGKGLSTGSEIEYADADTIKNALENRK
jgi:recombination protein RecR